jgi:hypothetical protein
MTLKIDIISTPEQTFGGSIVDQLTVLFKPSIKTKTTTATHTRLLHQTNKQVVKGSSLPPVTFGHH